MNAKFALRSLATALCILTSGVVLADVQRLSMLNRVEKGEWELRQRDEPGKVTRICLNDARRLIQLRHSRLNCSRMTVEDGAEEVAIQYTCPGHGYGRTQIRRESDSLLQIESQGIAEGLPFAFSAEARRLGDCRS
jgi:hypothetical protein